MKKLLVVRASGLTPEQACRGDVSANLSDLMADGSFARLSEAPDLPALVGEFPAGRAELVDVPCANPVVFDAALDGLRARASRSGASLVILSEAVFVSQRPFSEFKVGQVLSARDLPRLLGALLDG